jgi:hypothetical protein
MTSPSVNDDQIGQTANLTMGPYGLTQWASPQAVQRALDAVT